MREPLSIFLKLNNLICRDEDDGAGNAEPYLWTVFFKIDGETVTLTETLQLSGNGFIRTTPGSHGNLDDDSVDAGDTVPIPEDIGAFSTILRPIPVPAVLSSLIEPLGGVVGVACILMEEDNVSDDGAEAGHQALNRGVEDAINQIIATRSITNTDVSEDDVTGLQDQIIDSISDAIENQQNFFENLWSAINPDDNLGAKIFIFKHDDLVANMNQTFNQRWQTSNGDWEITGSITASPLCTIDLAGRLSARSGSAIDIDSIRRFRNEQFINRPGLREWGEILLRNNEYLIHAILRDEKLRSTAIRLAQSATDIINGEDAQLPDSVFDDVQPLIEVMEKSGDKRAQLDAKRLRELQAGAKGKTREELVTFLAGNAPGVKPKK